MKQDESFFHTSASATYGTIIVRGQRRPRLPPRARHAVGGQLAVHLDAGGGAEGGRHPPPPAARRPPPAAALPACRMLSPRKNC